MCWTPGQMGTDGNETADKSARQGSLHPFTGPERAIGVCAKFAWEVIGDWTRRKHEEYWQSIHGQRQAKGKGKVHPCTGTEALYRLYGP